MVTYIALVGIDGSGKTTHSRILSYFFEKHRIRVRTLYGRPPFFFSLPLLGLFRISGLTRVQKFKSRKTYITTWRESAPLVNLWLLLRLFDSVLFILFAFYILPFIFRLRKVVFDRFIIDDIVDSLIGGKVNFSLVNIFINLIPRKVRFILLDVDESLSVRRKGDTWDTLRAKRMRLIYLLLASKFGWYIVNSSSSLVKTSRRIVKIACSPSLISNDHYAKINMRGD